MKVTIEERLRLARFGRGDEAVDVLEHADGRLAKYPAVRVVTWYHPHADTEVAISGKY